MVDLTEFIRNRAQRVKNPSRRMPDRETALKNADNVQRQFQDDGYKVWGWVIYRCTYESETDWEAFITRIRFYIHDTLRAYNSLDMLESLNYHVFDDQALFDGARPATVREHFAQWAVTAPQQEQGTDAKQSQRYNYCIHVDKEALSSVISGPPPPENNLGKGFVNLVCLNIWGSMRPEHVEGRGENENCWMRIAYQDLMVTWHSLFRKQGSWLTEYRAPPEVGRPWDRSCHCLRLYLAVLLTPREDTLTGASRSVPSLNQSLCGTLEERSTISTPKVLTMLQKYYIAIHIA